MPDATPFLRRFQVRVVPRAAANAVLEMADGTLKARLTAPPVEGAANEALIRLLAEHFGVRRSRLRIVAGLASRLKQVEISS
ncbi:MAG: DUF167 domain-containing protein [Verrucomicrobiae bacterium]|nr:DUF167 domain-containing protein [Verrucomicrobiae bacterium]